MLSTYFHWLSRSLRSARPRPLRNPRRRRGVALHVHGLEARELLSTSIPLNAFNWTSLGPSTITQQTPPFPPIPGFTGGPGNTSGEITAIAPDPSDVNHIFIGTGGGGVYDIRIDPTDPTGQTYKATPLTNNLTDAAGNPLGGIGYIGALTIDPDNPLNLYAGTGDANYMGDSFAGKGILHSTDGGKTWTLEGTQQFAGYSIAKIQVDWTDSNVVFAAVTHGALGATPSATGNDGIWRSTDAGQTWTNLTAEDTTLGLNTAGNLAFTDVMVDPQSENLIFAVGEPGGNALNGVYLSTDATLPSIKPTTFELANGLQSGATVGRISLGSGWRSAFTTDWASIADTSGRLLQLGQVQNGAGPQGNFPWADATPTVGNSNGKNNPGVSLAPVLNDRNSFVNVGPTNDGNYTNALAVDPNNTDFVTLAGGSSFVIAPVGPKNANVAVDTDIIQNYYTNVISIPNMDWAAIADVSNSSPTGAPPFDFERDVGDYSHALTYDHFGNLYDATDTGLWRFSGFTGLDAKGNPFTFGGWTNLNLTLPITQYTSVGLVPNSNDIIFGGTRGVVSSEFQDGTGWINGNPVYGGPGGNFFIGLPNFDGAGRTIVDPRSVPDPTNPGGVLFGQDVYVATTDTLNQTHSLAFYRSQDGGQTFVSQSQGLGLSDLRDPSLPMVLDVPTDPTTRPARLLLGTDRLYVNYSPESANNSWTVLNYSLPAVFTTASARANGNIMAIGASPSNVNTLYLGVGNALLASIDDGVTWQDVTPAGADPKAVFTNITVDPNDPKTVYIVSPNDYDARGNVIGRVWMSHDGGRSWTEISSNLPTGAAPVDPWSIALLPPPTGLPNNVLVLGTDGGVYYSLNLGGSWKLLGAGLPNVAVRDLEYNPALDTLAAATYGAGIYEIHLKGTGAPPILGTPPAQFANEDSALNFGNAITVTDPAVLKNPVQATLTVTNGTLSLNPAALTGVVFTKGTGTGDTTATFTGPVASINAALNGLTYAPTPGYTGPDTLTIKVSDLGNTGGILSNPQTTTATVGLTVDPISLVFEANPGNQAAGATLPDVNVDVLDSTGAPLSVLLSQVTLTANGPSGAVLSGGATSVTATNGVATFSGLALNTAGSYTLSATAPGVPTVKTTKFTVTPGAAAGLAFASTPATVTAGTVVPVVTVNVVDAFGNAVASSAKVTISATGPGALGGTTSVNAANGVATFNSLVLKTAGSYTLTATATGLKSGSTASFTVSPAAASGLAFAAAIPATVAGTSLGNIVVDIVDAFGNLVPTGNAAVTLAANGPGALSGGSPTATAVNGVATINNNLTLTAAGSYTLTATAANLKAGTSQTFNITPSFTPSSVAFQGLPATAPAGTLPPINVALLDVFGNVMTGSSPDVTIALASGPGTLGGVTTVRAVNGVATFNTLTLTTPGNYTFSAQASGWSPATSGTLAVTAAAPATVAFETAPASTYTVAPIPNVKVDVLDAFGNLVTNAGAAVTITANGPGTFSPGSKTTVPAVNGVATFSNLVLPTAGTYSLTASSVNLQATTSASFQVTGSVASSLSFPGTLSGAAAGSAIPDFTVAVLDQAGNLYTPPLQVSISANGPGALAGSTTVTTAGGVATFTGLTLNVAGSYTLTATEAGLQATSGSFTVSAGAPVGLAFETLPTSLPAGQLPSVNVDLVDSFGNVATGNTASVSIAATGPGSLTGTTIVPATGGVASFSDLGLAKPGSYTLTATSGSLPTISTPLTITSGIPSQVAFEPLGSVTVAAGQKLPTFKVDVLDSAGNLISSTAQVTITPSVAGGITGTTTVAAVGGVATFTGIILQKAGSYPLIASASGLNPGTSGALTVTPATPNGLVFETMPASIAAGQALTDLKVDVVDQFGNVVTNTSSTVTLGANGPSSFSVGSNTAPTVNGVATFPALALTRPGSYTLTAAATGLNSASSNALTVTAGVPTKLVFLTVPTGGAAGQTLPAVTIEVFDGFGNPVTNSSIKVTIAAAGGAGVLTGTLTVPVSNGLATFTDLALSLGGTYTLTASLNGQAPVTSVPFAISGPTSATGTTTTSGGTTHVTVKTGLIFVSAPTVLHSNQTLPPVKLQLLNSKGKPLAHFKVTLQLKGGHLSGVLTKTTDAHGNVTFTGVKVGSLKTGKHSLVARASNKQTASHTVNVGAVKHSRRG